MATNLGSRADGARADHVDAQVPRDILCFDVQVVHDFQVIGDESDRRDYDVAVARGGQVVQGVADIGF